MVDGFLLEVEVGISFMLGDTPGTAGYPASFTDFTHTAKLYTHGKCWAKMG
jgi:hypothetical protein